MNVKIDTKEKFTVITPIDVKLTAIMTADLCTMLLPYQQKSIPHVIVNLKQVTEIDEGSAEALIDCQQNFYENDCSMVICCLAKPVEALLDEMEILELMNVTPTESEAWDIVQMEEVERELFKDEE